MKRNNLGVIPLVCAVVCGIAASACAFSKWPPGVLAESKAGYVTRAEVDTAVNRYERQIRRFSPDKTFSPIERETVWNSTLSDMVVSAIFVKMAQKRKTLVFDSEVRERFLIICSGIYNDDEKAFADALAADGWTLDEYNAHLRDILLAEKIRAEYIGEITVPDSLVARTYERDREKYRICEITISHILINAPDRDMPDRGLTSIRTECARSGIPPESLDAAVARECEARKAKLVAIRDSVLNGGDFAAFARKYSQDGTAAEGGRLGTVRKGVMTAPFEAAAFALRNGEVSGIVTTEFGYHIIKAHSDTLSRIQALDEVASAIEAQLRAGVEASKMESLEKKWKVKRYTINK